MRGGSEVPTELARRFVAVDCAKLTVADIDSIATWLRLELSGPDADRI
jgi:hypothetical protein